MNIKCHLRDHRIETSNSTPDFTTSVFGNFITHSLLQHSERPIYNETGLNYDIEKRSESHRIFIVHPLGDRSPWIAAVKNNKLMGHVVFASTKRVNQSELPKDTPGRCHACEWQPSDFAQPPARLGKWLEQVQSLKIDEIDWDLLSRDVEEPSEVLLAFRLLCDAWKLGAENPALRCHGIAIQAPNSLKRWLAPFKTGEAEPTKEAVITSISEESREPCRKLLDAVAAYDIGLQSGDEASREEAMKSLQGAVNSFLNFKL